MQQSSDVVETEPKRSLISLSAIYLISNLINSAIPFLLLPILTRALSPAEYGAVGMFQTTIAAMAAFIGVSVQGASLRKYYDKGDHENLSAFIGSCMQILLFSALLVLVVLTVFSEQLAFYTGLTTDWLYFALAVCVADFVVQLRLTQWQVRNKAISYGFTQLVRTVLNLTLSLLFVVSLTQGADGRILAIVLSSVAIGVFALGSLKFDGLLTFWRFRKDYIEEALKFGVPLIPHVSGAFLVSAADRFFINTHLGAESTGFYMVAVQLAMGLAIIFDSFNRAFAPWLYSNLSSGSTALHGKVVRYTYFYYGFLLALIPLAFLIGPAILVFIAGEKYSAAGGVVGYLVAGQIFGGMYLMVTNYVFYSKKVGLLSLITISAGLINLLLLVLLLPVMGIKGAALSFCISMFIQFVFTWLLAARRHPMPWLSTGRMI